MRVEESPELQLRSSGLRFVSESTEAEYREWFLRRIESNAIRIVIAAYVVWGAVGAALWAEGDLSAWLAWSLLVLFANYAAVLACLRRNTQLLRVLSYPAGAIGGVLAVMVASEHSDGHLPLAVGCFAVSFVSVSMQNGSIAAIWPSIVTAMATGLVLVERHDAGAGVTGQLIAWLTLGFTTWLALLFTFNNERLMRTAFRQEHIIEAQKLVIERERARGEELLQREIAHQVAARSRELGTLFTATDAVRESGGVAVGAVFDDRYAVIRRLGAGGMGVVFEVERTTDAARLALKVLVHDLSRPSAARFAREAEIGSRVRHPNVVSIVDVGVAAGVPYLVMEYISGGSLEDVRSRFGDAEFAVPVLCQVAEGLLALHQAGVVHRDLKPGNVLLTSEGVAKISDFGIARWNGIEVSPIETDTLEASVSDDTLAPTPPNTPVGSLTVTGMLLGTPLYMAPEAGAGGKHLDSRADVFSFAVLACELLTGSVPYATPPIVLAAVRRELPATDLPLAPGALRSMLERALCADPAGRPALAEILAVLQAPSTSPHGV